MFRKFLKRGLVELLKPVVVDILKMDLTSEVFELKDVKMLELKRKLKKHTIYEIPELYNVREFHFDVTYTDPTCDAKVDVHVVKKSFSEFKSALQKIHRSKTPYEFVKSCSFILVYEHPMQNQRAYDFMLDSRTGYKAEAVNKCAKTILDWIDEHPEWLV